MTRYILIIITLFASLAGSTQCLSQTPDKPYFPTPLVPDSLKTLQQRSEFMVEHYWDFCDFKKSFSSKPKMAESFNTYLSFMPYASAEVTHMAVAKFLKNLKNNPTTSCLSLTKLKTHFSLTQQSSWRRTVSAIRSSCRREQKN